MTSGKARTRFTRTLAVLFVAVCASAFTPSARAEIAGLVLTAIGDVLTLRGSQILRLLPGSAIESGDQIHTGAESSAQIRFTDSGLIWIRPHSDFVVDEYVYGKDGRERAFFSLLRGGVRSLTGLIGHRTRANYRLRGPVATIGIRGTDFSVVICQNDCRNPDGGPAAKGLYGEVIEGRIAVAPLADRALEREFGAGEFFHLGDESSIPTPLFLPPPFLRNKLDEQARLKEQLGPAAVPARPVAPAPNLILSNLLGDATTGGVTGAISGLTGTLGNTLQPLVGSTVDSLTTLPVLTSAGSLVGSTVNLLTTLPVLTSVGSLVGPTTNSPPTLTPGGTPVVLPAGTPIGVPTVPSIALPGGTTTGLPTSPVLSRLLRP